MKRERMDGEGLLRRIRGGVDRLTFHCARMEITGDERVVVEGANEILEYGTERIRLSVCDARVRSVVIEGRALCCLSYHPDAVVVTGEILSVCFCREEMR